MFAYRLKQYFRKSLAIPGSGLKNQTTGKQKNGGGGGFLLPPVAISVKESGNFEKAPLTT